MARCREREVSAEAPAQASTDREGEARLPDIREAAAPAECAAVPVLHRPGLLQFRGSTAAVLRASLLVIPAVCAAAVTAAATAVVAAAGSAVAATAAEATGDMAAEAIPEVPEE